MISSFLQSFMMNGAELCFPQLLNSSCRKTSRPQSDSILIYIILCCISPLTVTLNLLVIISISHFRQLHTPTNLLLLSLAVSDFFVGFSMASQIMLIDDCWYLGDLPCVMFCVVTIIITSVSVGTMVLISVDRYVAICDPLHYPTKVTSKRVHICVSLCWISSFTYAVVMLRDNLKQPGRFNSCSGECVIYLGFIENVADLFITFITPISIIVFLYFRVFVVVVSQVRAMRSHIGAAILQRSEKTIIKKSELKAAVTLGIVVLVFLSCIFPYYCFIMLSKSASLKASSMSFMVCLFYMNSCVNPLIYALFYPWFRKSIKLIVTFRVLKRGSRDSNVHRKGRSGGTAIKPVG
ncbi:trace amine-associated receptor 13c-like [Odontesthes bonariensis]|uniref:trace amine-associated receptor 13c-like n=1 Tax=Odontesthes bonariensis TaxID=219752 RepID=UPI003F58DF8F